MTNNSENSVLPSNIYELIQQAVKEAKREGFELCKSLASEIAYRRCKHPACDTGFKIESLQLPEFAEDYLEICSQLKLLVEAFKVCAKCKCDGPAQSKSIYKCDYCEVLSQWEKLQEEKE